MACIDGNLSALIRVFQMLRNNEVPNARLFVSRMMKINEVGKVRIIVSSDIPSIIVSSLFFNLYS